MLDFYYPRLWVLVFFCFASAFPKQFCLFQAAFLLVLVFLFLLHTDDSQATKQGNMLMIKGRYAARQLRSLLFCVFSIVSVFCFLKKHSLILRLLIDCSCAHTSSDGHSTGSPMSFVKIFDATFANMYNCASHDCAFEFCAGIPILCFFFLLATMQIQPHLCAHRARRAIKERQEGK